MIVLTILVGVVRIISRNDVLKETKGELYSLEWCDNEGKWQPGLDAEILKKINEINLPGTVYTMRHRYSFNLIKKGKQQSFNFAAINKSFSEILDVEFTSGNSFSDKHLGESRQFVIISQKIANFFFDEKDVVGREILIAQRRYTVVGVFRNLIENNEYGADVYTIGMAPYVSSVVASTLISVDSKESLSEAETLLNKHIKSNLKDGASFRLTSLQVKKLANLDSIILGSILMIVLAFILPALLLSNLTIHRMESRLNELGIRKAFGADKKTIYRQLITENLIFTLVAGIVALFIGQFLIYSFYYGAGVQGNWFSLILPSDLYFLILFAFVVFGLITGIIPARKVSRQSIIHSLNTK